MFAKKRITKTLQTYSISLNVYQAYNWPVLTDAANSQLMSANKQCVLTERTFNES